MNESIEASLARLRESGEPADKDFLQTHASYLESRDPRDAILPATSNAYLFGLTSLAKLAAAAYPHDSDARVLAELALLNLDGGKVDHPFNVYKPYPGAGVEAVLMTDNYWVGIDPTDTVQLGSAYFVSAGTVERGSYTYDEPGSDDPRVLRFDQVPAVVWSETLADLKAIIGEA